MNSWILVKKNCLKIVNRTGNNKRPLKCIPNALQKWNMVGFFSFFSMRKWRWRGSVREINLCICTFRIFANIIHNVYMHTHDDDWVYYRIPHDGRARAYLAFTCVKGIAAAAANTKERKCVQRRYMIVGGGPTIVKTYKNARKYIIILFSRVMRVVLYCIILCVCVHNVCPCLHYFHL